MTEQFDPIAHLLTDNSFLRWINGDASRTERDKWDQWLKEDPGNRYLLEQAIQLHHSLQFEEENPDTEKQLQQLTYVLHKNNIKKRTIGVRSKASHHWYYVAAAIVLLISAIVVLKQTKQKANVVTPVEKTVTDYITVQTEYGEIKTLKFSDGSTIVLNANSTLTYPKTYAGGHIVVELQGEAYFSITHLTGTQQRTFTVQANGVAINVLGTKFNVLANGANTEVVLQQGKVQLETLDSLNANQHEYIMQPGQLVQLNSESMDFSVKQVNPEFYTSWTQLELKFNYTSLQEIANRIERTYGVKVKFTSDRYKIITFSGTAPNNNLTVLIEGLSLLLDIPVTYDGDMIVFGN